MKRWCLKLWYRLTKKSPDQMPMVQYWKYKDSVQAKVIRSEDGSLHMKMEGEEYDFPTFPRGHILYGRISKLKHEIKNQIFNDSWYALERGEDRKEVIRRAKGKLLGEIADLAASMKYDMLPVRSMTPSVREIHRAWTKVAPAKTYPVRDYFCFILQEDDAYRFRVQWVAKYFPGWFRYVKHLDKALQMMEHAEVIGDMKERIRLLRRIVLLALEDPVILDLFNKLVREIDWKKVALTEADKYHFRGKYFKVDFDLLEY